MGYYDDYDKYDVERLRRDLIDYFGSATPIMPIAYSAVNDVEERYRKAVEYGTLRDLLQIVAATDLDLNDYIINDDDEYTRHF